MSETRLALVILAVADLDASVRFYRAAFGWPSPVETPVYVEFELPGGMRLGLYRRESFVRNLDRLAPDDALEAVTGAELYFQTNELAEATGLLASAGASVLSEAAPRDWGDEAAYFADPEGNVVVVARPIDGRNGASNS